VFTGSHRSGLVKCALIAASLSGFQVAMLSLEFHPLTFMSTAMPRVCVLVELLPSVFALPTGQRKPDVTTIASLYEARSALSSPGSEPDMMP
jgi:hypothetical protein